MRALKMKIKMQTGLGEYTTSAEIEFNPCNLMEMAFADKVASAILSFDEGDGDDAETG